MREKVEKRAGKGIGYYEAWVEIERSTNHEFGKLGNATEMQLDGQKARENTFRKKRKRINRNKRNKSIVNS